MLTGRIIICFVIVVLAIQFLSLPQTGDPIYNDDSTETCINSVAIDDGSDFNNLVSSVSLALYKQVIFPQRFYTKIFPGFPVCIYSAYSTDIPTPPPDKSRC